MLRVLAPELVPLALEQGAILDRLALRARPRADARTQRARREVAARLLGAHLFRRTFDPHLALELLPHERERGARIDGELLALLALVVGEEHEAARVGALEEHDAGGWMAARVDRRQRHRRGLGNLRLNRRLHPLLELPQRIPIDGRLVERLPGILIAKVGEVHW